MMKNILKFQYTFKFIFSCIKEKRKLDIVKYNKNMQKILDIGIINYKTFNGKYIIGERNGKGKEYYINDNLIFEGEYLNGKRNGKGKEYNINDNLIFEGEYLNGKRNGKGKEYDCTIYVVFAENLNQENKENNNLIFEGEYVNGIRNGKGREYDSNGCIKFEGEYNNGKRWNGIEIEYFDEEIINNGIKPFIQREIKGIKEEKADESKLKFEFEYLNGKKWNGKISYVKNNEIICELKEGKGFIIEVNDDKEEFYIGEYLNGQKSGKGKEYYYYDGTLKFEGE
jgi:antitoxin component YwqK of YwqJK toxin-antitoxin module